MDYWDYLDLLCKIDASNFRKKQLLSFFTFIRTEKYTMITLKLANFIFLFKLLTMKREELREEQRKFPLHFIFVTTKFFFYALEDNNVYVFLFKKCNCRKKCL